METAITLVLTVLVAGVLGAGKQPAFAPPPRLAITAQELAELKASPDFNTVKAGAVQAAEPLLANPPPIPQGYGHWVFNYACPDDGSDLQPLSPTEHKCPTCGKVYADERTVAAYRCLQHYEIEHAAVKLGWAYAYTGDDRYAQGVRRILAALADAYGTYPGRQDRWGHTGILAPLGGRRYVQSLDEAVGAVQLAKAYDLTRDSPAYSETDRKHIENDFFRATADSLLRFNQDVSNHQTWYNAGLMAIASVLGDAKLVDRVLTMRGGFYDQLQRSVGAEGLWHEGTMAYHNYAFQAMVEIADAGLRMGLPLQAAPKFRSMFEGPLKAAYPNGQFPAINDSDPASLSAFDWAFQWAWKAYGDPLFAQAYARGDAQRLRSLMGAGAEPTWPMGEGSVVLSDAGLAKLQVGTGAPAVCVFLDYGPHGGGHGHLDKLNITLYAGGREWLLDPGRLTYSHPEYKTWVKHTAAHNTVALDGRSQEPTTGRLLWFEASQDRAACGAEASDAYLGAVLRRYLLLTPQMLVDVFEVSAEGPAQVDWFAHALSDRVEPVEGLGEGEPASPGKADGYQHLTDARRWLVTGTSRWDFVTADRRLRLWLADTGAEQVFVATGIGYWVNQKVPCLVRRHTGSDVRFVAVYDLSGSGQYVRAVEPSEGAALGVQAADGAWDIKFGMGGLTRCEHEPPAP